MACYRYYLEVVKRSKGKSLTSDSDLLSLVIAIKNSTPTLPFEINEENELIEVALKLKIISVAHELQENRAITLPSAHSRYKKNIELLLPACKFPLTTPKLGTPRWLLGQLSTYVLYIKTGEARPVAQYPRRLAYHWVDKVKEETASLEKLGITATSSSPWSSPIVPVPKPDGSVRPCTDYKALNAITETVVYPLPRMEEVLQEVAGAQFITTMDLAKGFLQIPVAKEDQHKTAFVTPHGKWEYSRLPFGLKNAPAHFQKVMDTVLAGVHGARAYIDDVVVYTQTWEEHLKVLELTLQALAKHGFKIHR